MATAKPHPIPQGRRRTRKLVVIVVILAGLVLAAFWPTVRGYAGAGAAVGARVGCSCRYLGGRELSDCRKDFEPGMGLVVLSEDAAAKSVTARVPLLSRETAFFREGEGCMLERWPD
ncbi:MAG: hypothetical protein ABIQ81_08990 [Novosphingobium sp.]